MAAAPVIRLHPDDGVLIARSSKEAEQMRSASPQGNDVH